MGYPVLRQPRTVSLTPDCRRHILPMMSTPLPFAPPALHDAPAVRRAVRHAQQSDLAFANMYLLRHKYHTELALEGAFLFRHFRDNSRLEGYAFPCGEGDIGAALRRVEEDAALRFRPFAFCLLTEEQCNVLERAYPGRFRFACDPGNADYLYLREELVGLPGARFHRKRNHLERFIRQYPAWEFRELRPSRVPDALAVASAWLVAAQVKEGAGAGMQHEFEAIVQALEHREELGLCGGVLYVGEEPVAMALASFITPEVADIHYEKCHPDFRTAYPLINREMAAALPCRLINREEDLNMPGLRQAKLSYFPSCVLSKYSALPC